jgi:glycosyltransferase involved in cell wall biosynthesis
VPANWFDRETLDRVITDYIQKVDVVLDIGCGIRPQTFFRPQIHICCEPYLEYVKVLQNRFAAAPYVIIIQATAQQMVEMMPDRAVDSVFLIDVIEHLEKQDGYELLKECERIARKQVVCFTPLGFMRQEYRPGDRDGWGLSGGEWQNHKSGWVPEDFDTSWQILASESYHTTSGSGEAFDNPFGAFWAIRDLEQTGYIASPTKFAVLSNILPPSPSGQAMVLYRLLRDLNPEHYCLLSRQNYDVPTSFQTTTYRLLAPYYRIPMGWQIQTPDLPALRAGCKVINAVLVFIRRALAVAQIVRRRKCEAVVACTGDPFDLPAGYLASRWTRVPFYAYIFDDYVYQWFRDDFRLFAERMAPLVLRGAAGVIVPNEFLQDEYRQRYGIEPVVIHNPCESLDTDAHLPWPAAPPEIRVVYTGAIYGAHYDAFRNLLVAIQLMDRPELRLHVYTAQPPTELEREHIRGPVTYHGHLPSQEVLDVQRQADILFLPLAFDSPYPEAIIRTSAPGKMGEYLASGRPVLAHAPADSFVSWYFRTYQVGSLVDRPNAAALAQAIEQILDEPDLRRKRCENALERAQIDFSLEATRGQFLSLLQTATCR